MFWKEFVLKIYTALIICSVFSMNSFSQEFEINLLGGYTKSLKSAVTPYVIGTIEYWQWLTSDKITAAQPMENVPELPDIESNLFDTALVIAFKGSRMATISSIDFVESDDKIVINYNLSEEKYQVPDWYDSTGTAMTTATVNMFYLLYSKDVDVTEKSIEFVDLTTSVKPEVNYKTPVSTVRPKHVSKNRCSSFNLLGRITGIKKTSGYRINSNHFDTRKEIVLKNVK